MLDSRRQNSRTYVAGAHCMANGNYFDTLSLTHANHPVVLSSRS